MKVSEMTAHQKHAYQVMREAYSETIGALFCSAQDNELDHVPTIDEAITLVFDMMMWDTKHQGSEIRFVGREWIEERIRVRYTRDVDELTELFNKQER